MLRVYGAITNQRMGPRTHNKPNWNPNARFLVRFTLWSPLT